MRMYFDFGSALSSTELRNAGNRLPLYSSQYSIITPENELKPENVLDLYNSAKVSKDDQGSVALHFNSVKPLLEFAKANGLKVHGHVLFWHSQTPDEFFRESYSRNQALCNPRRYARAHGKLCADHDGIHGGELPGPDRILGRGQRGD